MKPFLAIILARGGSKTIPKKNIKPINGRPLIAYTIIKALECKYIDKLVVSTDCEAIATTAKTYGAEIPFIRPKKLSGDTVWSRDALKHAVLECEKIHNKKWNYIIELPCTSPLKKTEHIDEVCELLLNNNVDSVTSVCRMWDKHPVRMKKITESGLLENFCTVHGEQESSRKQDLEPCYIRNGAIYAMTRNCIVNQFSRHGKQCKAYVMDEKYSVNIDSPIDLKLAEIYLNEQN